MAPRQFFLTINLFEVWSKELSRRQKLESSDELYMSSITASRARLSFYHFLCQLAEDNQIVIENEKLLWRKSAGKVNKNLTPEDFLSKKLDYNIEDSKTYFEEILRKSSQRVKSLPLSTFSSYVRNSLVFLTKEKYVNFPGETFPILSTSEKTHRSSSRVLCPIIESYLLGIGDPKIIAINRSYLRTFEDAALNYLGLNEIDQDAEISAFEKALNGYFRLTTPQSVQPTTVTELICLRPDLAVDKLNLTILSKKNTKVLFSSLSFFIGSIVNAEYSMFDWLEIINPRSGRTTKCQLDIVKDYLSKKGVSSLSQKTRYYWLSFILDYVEKQLPPPINHQDRLERRVFLEFMKDTTGVKASKQEKKRSVTYALVTKREEFERKFSLDDVPESVKSEVVSETRNFFLFLSEQPYSQNIPTKKKRVKKGK